jgi:hypothetical protein
MATKIRSKNINIVKGVSPKVVKGVSPKVVKGVSPKVVKGVSPKVVKGVSPKVVKGVSPIKKPPEFLVRLGGLDWLLGLMSVERNKFPSYVSLGGDAVEIINTFIPGNIIDNSSWISRSHFMPFLIRGWKLENIKQWGGHGENLGIFGMAYVYFGLIFGPVFLLIWTFISLKVIEGRAGVMLKILYFQCFVTEIILGGYLVIGFKIFYEGILMFGLIFMLAKIASKFKCRFRRIKDNRSYPQCST